MDSVLGEIRSKLLLELKIQYAHGNSFLRASFKFGECAIFYTYRTAEREELSSTVQLRQIYVGRRPQEECLNLASLLSLRLCGFLC